MNNRRTNNFKLVHRTDITNSLVALHSLQNALPMEEAYKTGFQDALAAVAKMVGEENSYLSRTTQAE